MELDLLTLELRCRHFLRKAILTLYNWSASGRESMPLTFDISKQAGVGSNSSGVSTRRRICSQQRSKSIKTIIQTGTILSSTFRQVASSTSLQWIFWIGFGFVYAIDPDLLDVEHRFAPGTYIFSSNHQRGTSLAQHQHWQSLYSTSDTALFSVKTLNTYMTQVVSEM